MTVVEDIAIDGDDGRNVIGGKVGDELLVQQIRIVRGRPEMVLSEDEIRGRTKTYVPVGDHEAIRKTLELYRFVALAGPAGTGVETTAVAVLGQLLPAARIHRFSTEQDDVEEMVHLGMGDGYIVRARDAEPSQLRSFLCAVRASRGLAVIIGTAAEQRRFAGFPPPIAVEPPPAEAVYRSHLLHRRVHPRWLDWPRGGGLLKDASPGDASRLAGLVDEIGPKNGEQEVEQAYRSRAEHLHAWFEACKEGGRLVFSRHGFADSVPDHVCAEHLPAQADLLAWLEELPASPVLEGESEYTHRVVRLFARLASRYDVPERITGKAREWAEGQDHEADFAYIVLSDTCLDPVVGGRVRNSLYEWSRQSRTPQTLKLTIARVCQIIGQAYLPVALTRLMHLATHGDAQVRQEVVEVAGELAEHDASTVFTTALRWVRSTRDLPPGDGASRLDAAIRVLLDLLPAFGQAGPHQVLEAVGLVAAEGHPRLRPHLLEHALTLAGEHPLPVLAFALDQSGAPDSPLPRQIFGTELFLSLIASARSEDLPALLTDGIDPLDTVTAWAIALETPVNFPDFAEALSRWLDLAETRSDLIDPLYAAAWPSRKTRRLLADLVTRRTDDRPGRRRVGEALLVRIRLPEWRRRLLVTRIRLRDLRAQRREFRDGAVIPKDNA